MICIYACIANLIAQNVGIGTTSPKARLHVADSSVVFTGPASIPAVVSSDPPVSGGGTRMMWYAEKAAFRVGAVYSDQWDKEQIGRFSFASGVSTIAKGDYSTAMGSGTKASAVYSTAMGTQTEALGSHSTAMGEITEAKGFTSTAMGYLTKANGNYSTTAGYSTRANGFSSFVVGIYNDTLLATQFSLTENTPLFIIGNGVPSDLNRSNAMVVLNNGNVAIGNNRNPVTRLHITGGTDAGYADNSGFLTIGNINGANIVFDNNEIMARSNGVASNLYIQNSGGNTIINPSEGKVIIGSVSAGGTNLLDVNGTAGKPNGGSWAGYSDQRLKQDIEPYTNGLAYLLQVNPVWFRYNQISGFDTAPKYVGILAQELQQTAPYMVTATAKKMADGTDGYLQVDNSAMTYMLINAVKELNQKIIDLEKKLAEK